VADVSVLLGYVAVLLGIATALHSFKMLGIKYPQTQHDIPEKQNPQS